MDPDIALTVDTGYHDNNAWLSIAALIAAAISAIGASRPGHARRRRRRQRNSAPNTRRVLRRHLPRHRRDHRRRRGLIAPAAWVMATNRIPAAAATRLVGIGRLLPPANLTFVITWPTLITPVLGIPSRKSRDGR